MYNIHILPRGRTGFDDARNADAAAAATSEAGVHVYTCIYV